MNYYSIEDVEKKTGITKRNIKYWCSMYGVKLKKQGKRNLYDENAVNILKIIKKITDSGYFTMKYIKAKLDWNNGDTKQFEEVRDFEASVDNELSETKDAEKEKTEEVRREKTKRMETVKREKNGLPKADRSIIKRSFLDDIDNEIKQFWEKRKENKADNANKIVEEKKGKNEKNDRSEVAEIQAENIERDIGVIVEKKESPAENITKKETYEEERDKKISNEIIGDVFVENKKGKGLLNIKNILKKIAPKFKINDEKKIDILKEKLANDKNNIIMINQLGMEYAKNGYYKEAVEEFKRAIVMNPGYTDAYYNIGVVFDEMGDRKKAREYWEVFLGHEQEGKFSEEIRKKLKYETGDKRNGN